MTDPAAAWPAELPARLREPLTRCAQGEIPPSVAAMQLLMEVSSEPELALALAQVEAWLSGLPGPEGSRVREAATVIRDHPQAWAMTKSVLAEAAHDRPASSVAENLAHWAGAFDRAVLVSPEGSVALYSLGDPALLRAATDEVVARLEAWGLAGQNRALLDFGCGIGRFAGALAPKMRFVVGVDLSFEMLRVSARRCADRANASFVRMGGGDLAMFADEAFDLVLAADVYPYLVESGETVLERQVAEAARVLKRGGDLLILNLSYREDVEADRRDLAAIADRHGLNITRSGSRDFQLWDAQTFHLVKAH